MPEKKLVKDRDTWLDSIMPQLLKPPDLSWMHPARKYRLMKTLRKYLRKELLKKES